MQAAPPIQPEPMELEHCTLDQIVDVLCEGRPINLPDGADAFVLDNDDARAVLGFYAKRKEFWVQAKQVVGAEAEQLLAAIAKPTAHVATGRFLTTGIARPHWRIQQLRAHRFAGLHRHCGAAGKAPEVFTLQLDRDVTCIWGFNGAGKSALQSAMMWCLTGKAHRSQHMPSHVHNPISVEVISSGSNDEKNFTLPAIVPLPSAQDLLLLADRPACDTWVEIDLRDQDGNFTTVRRELKRNDRGVVSEVSSGLEALALPQWAIEAGTLMPAIAANMRFDDKTSFAEAIAQLTGLRPLQDLGLRLPRMVRRLDKDETDSATDAKDSARIQFVDGKKSFLEAWRAESETLGPEPDLLTPDKATAEQNCSNAIAAVRARLIQHQATGLVDIETILGSSASAETSEHSKALLNQLAFAREHLSSAALAGLPSLRVLQQVKEISDADKEWLVTKLNELAQRAETHVKRQQNKQQAARQQLYTMVAQWHQRQNPDQPITDCPVCGTDLAEVPADALLDSDIAAALQIGLRAHNDAAKSLAEWQQAAASELNESLPESLKFFVDYKTRTSILDLCKSAYVVEALKDNCFATDLRPLQSNAHKLWDALVAKLPLSKLELPDQITLPKDLAGGVLANRFANLQHALTLGAQRNAVDGLMQPLLANYLGTWSFSRGEKIDEVIVLRMLPIRHQVLVLTQAINAAEPLIGLTRQIDVIEAARNRWVAASQRLRLIKRAAIAVQTLTRLPELVEHQVQGLIHTLEARTTAWLNLIYRPHYNGGPRYVGLDPSRTQGIGLYAGFGNVRVQAHQIMNSSHLRACVWAFVFSLWERIRARTGALEILQLDDPQTFFDPINTENVAAAVPALVAAGMAILITSNDNRFIAAVKDKLPRSSSALPSWTMLQISPLSSSRSTIALTPTIDEVKERHQTWADSPNDVVMSQQFVERVRLHIENRLWDLLAADPMLIYKPTLADLIGHIAAARNAGEPPFHEPPFEKLLNCCHLKTGTHFYTAINQAHHDLRKITPYDAGVVADGFLEVDRMIRSCAASYARFMGRLTRDDEDMFFAEAPPAPAALVNTPQHYHVHGDFSAKTQDHVASSGEPAATLSLESLGEIALYAIQSDSLGAFARKGQVVIVSLDRAAKCGEPVVALYNDKIFARRYHSDKSDVSKLTLACEQSVSERVAPALVLRRNKVRLMPIVGVLYDSVVAVGRDEAQVLSKSAILGAPLTAARVVDYSGYPLIRHHDWVLLESHCFVNSESLQGLQGELVAFVASKDGHKDAYLKRVGIAISGELRIFESAGTFGDAVAVWCGSEKSPGFPHLISVWRVRGVLRGLNDPIH
ncbi:ATP-binding protein [Pseudomonas sivasensis]|uniref:ATP-binding protein n=1 Tax=Pseudomonas sivasensis TaxID=1880678 RepID=UPI003B9E4005